MRRPSAIRPTPKAMNQPRPKIITRVSPHSSSENAYAPIPTIVARQTPITTSSHFHRLWPLRFIRSPPISNLEALRLLQLPQGDSGHSFSRKSRREVLQHLLLFV